MKYSLDFFLKLKRIADAHAASSIEGTGEYYLLLSNKGEAQELMDSAFTQLSIIDDDGIERPQFVPIPYCGGNGIIVYGKIMGFRIGVIVTDELSRNV